MAINTIATLVALEAVLRVVDFRELREGVSERSLSYQYDADLGWLGYLDRSLQPRSPALKSNSTKTCRADKTDQSFAADSLEYPYKLAMNLKRPLVPRRIIGVRAMLPTML